MLQLSAPLSLLLLLLSLADRIAVLAVQDACGVEGGTNNCIDCAGMPSGGAVRDECGVCNGAGTSCRTCRYDERDLCGVCFGDSSSCLDCQGTPNGPFHYDACGICGGPNEFDCRDCNGELDGGAVYDLCDVCGGDSTSCLDCAGVLHGTKRYDACDVCGGSGACLDCAGVPHGLAAYDACDVCDGNNTECRDCAGTLHGTHVVDQCGNCVPASALLDEHGRKTQCALAVLQRDIDNSLGLYLTVVFIALASFFFLVLLCVRRARRFWYSLFWLIAAWFAVTEPSALKRASLADARRVGRGRGAMPKTVVFSVALLGLLVARADAISDSQAFYNDICQYTNINSALAAPTCNVPNGDACTAWTSYGIIECDLGLIRKVRFDTMPTLGGRILPSTFALLSSAHSISFRGRTDGASLPLSTEFNLRQLTFVDFNAFDFTDFSGLSLLRIATSHFNFAGLPGSISAATNLETLSITDSDLGGTVISEVCQLTKLSILELINTQLTGPSMCDPVALVALNTLDLSNNRLGSPLRNFSSLPNLIGINYNNNQLEGLLDASLFPQSLTVLSVKHNRFTSVTQNWLPFGQKIFQFYISHNNIGGPIPYVDWQYVYYYDVSWNRFDSWDSTGYFSTGLWPLIDVSHNRLSGPVPGFTSGFSAEFCHFEHNLFCNLSDINPELIESGCTWSLTPSVCGCVQPDCVDCLGVPLGDALYDECDICAGDGNLCRDCAGVRHGTSRYDECDVCNGNGDTCRDCAGIALGSSTYDVCDVCNGDSSTCGDCSGAPRGPYRYDACGVCTLPGPTANLTCIDCRGVPNGPARFDELGVCEGDGDFGRSRLSRAVRDGIGAFWSTVGLAAFLAVTLSLLALALVLLSVAARRR